MSLLLNMAEKFFDKYGDALTENVHAMVAAAPKGNVGEREMRRDHDRWMRSAELGRPYYTEDSEYAWIGLDWEPLRLVCYPRYTFVRRTAHGLYTADGRYSWDAYYRAGAKGLITTEPPRPERPKELRIKGDLRDAAHPERWDIEYVDL